MHVHKNHVPRATIWIACSELRIQLKYVRQLLRLWIRKEKICGTYFITINAYNLYKCWRRLTTFYFPIFEVQSYLRYVLNLLLIISLSVHSCMVQWAHLRAVHIDALSFWLTPFTPQVSQYNLLSRWPVISAENENEATKKGDMFQRTKYHIVYAPYTHAGGEGSLVALHHSTVGTEEKRDEETVLGQTIP